MAAIAALASAQWPNQPTPGVPRTPDGKFNLCAASASPATGDCQSGCWWPVICTSSHGFDAGT